jgi:peptidylprolyl isomerase
MIFMAADPTPRAEGVNRRRPRYNPSAMENKTLFAVVAVAAVALIAWALWPVAPATTTRQDGFATTTADAPSATTTPNAKPVTATSTARARFQTSAGDFVLELYTGQMPITTGNFIKLAKEGYYDGTKFHRVIEGFMVQGGDPLTKDDAASDRWGTGGPGYNIEDEFVTGLSNVRGTIAMANTGRPNTGGSQFFINLVDNTNLDFDKPPMTSRHPVFGKIVEGMDVIDEIGAVATDERDRPIEAVVIQKVTIE